MRIALAQMAVTWGLWEENVHKARTFMEEASRQGATWVILPEMWACGFHYETIHRLASRTCGLLNDLLGWAKSLGLGIVGSLPEKAPEGIYNTAYVISPAGELLGTYRKVHLFVPIQEDRHLRPGRDPLLIRWGETTVGLVICYDLRFPEMTRFLAARGMDMLWVCAHWPHPRLEHWRLLMRARAVENQIFVLGSNACGKEGSLHFFGHSMAVDPWGEVLEEGGEDEGLVFVDVDLTQIRRVRESLPVLDTVRKDLYCISWKVNETDKRLDIKAAGDLVELARQKGRVVVFTNGCFDLLHAGHIQYLEGAKALGDLLVVGINSDASMQRIKGPKRPIISLEDRIMALAGLECVDVIVPFDEETPRRLIQCLRPHILVKGADWPEEAIVGADLVRSWGGRVVRLPLRDGLSTSGIIQKILERFT